MTKQLLFSITSKDFDQQTFSVGGHGGSGKDTSNSGVRLIHRASGAVAEGREHRSNSANRQAAFRKLVDSRVFKAWHKIECAHRMGQQIPETKAQILERVDRIIEQDLRSGQIQITTYEV